MSNGASVIADVLTGWEGDVHLEREVFATIEPVAIAAAVDDFCRSHLDASVSRYEFFATSVGSVHGVQLSDGRRVVIKAYRSDADRDHLLAVQRVQTRLSAAQFPSPRPILGPTPLANGLALVESLLDQGSWANAHEPAVRGEMAAALARLIELCRPLAALEGLHSIRDATQRLWRQPHDRRFDFPGTAHGAEWIDRLFRAATERLDQLDLGPGVVGHCDYRAEHVRFTDGRISAVYDWDSLAVGPEPVVVGLAANAFTADWSRDGWHLPTLAESFEFISDYQTARDRPFTSEERRATSAALVAALSYGARCEHSDRLTHSAPSRQVQHRAPCRPARAWTDSRPTALDSWASVNKPLPSSPADPPDLQKKGQGELWQGQSI